MKNSPVLVIKTWLQSKESSSLSTVFCLVSGPRHYLNMHLHFTLVQASLFIPSTGTYLFKTIFFKVILHVLLVLFLLFISHLITFWILQFNLNIYTYPNQLALISLIIFNIFPLFYNTISVPLLFCFLLQINI